MERDLYIKLLAWKSAKQRKPLLVQGARQVGKTYLLKAFGAAEYKYCCYINFEENPEFKKFFEGNLQPKRILRDISLHLDIEIDPVTTLIFFDEIQESPNALTSLKYFNEQASEYSIVAAGSLLGVKLSQAKGFPVGKVNFLNLYPCSFLEFLNAIGKSNLRKYLQEIKTFEPISEVLHQQLIELLRIYTVVGGMPEAVRQYADNNDLTQIRKIQNEILKAYLLDFAKHAPSNDIMKITQVWESIPNQLARENKKFAFGIVRENARAREYEDAIQWLVDAGLIYKVSTVSAPRLPLKSYSDKRIFKVYMLDVGLLGAMSQLSPRIVLEGDALFTEFKGALTENLAAQLLKAQHDCELYYWKSEGEAEVDFLIQNEGKIWPLEVKSGISTKKKSLYVYQQKYKSSILSRASLMNLKHDGDIYNYPLYLMSQFPLGCYYIRDK